jgi:hypothetical protein
LRGIYTIGILFTFYLMVAATTRLYSQSKDSLQSQFKVNLEIRPRAEYRFNYFHPPGDSAVEYFNVVQRNRLGISYTRKKWLFKSDFQEIHVWDEKHSASKVGSLNFYQLFFETKFKRLNVRLGRQGVLLDNGRIFSDAPWSQQGRAHEGLRLMANFPKFQHDAFILFTRKYGDRFDANFSPVAAHRYKYLLIHHLSYNANKSISFNTINAMDVFNDTSSGNMHTRFTIGGRIEIKNKQWYGTINSYFQFGKTPQGKSLTAYYLQPELKLTHKKTTWRLGAEIISGTKSRYAKDQSSDFDVLYGVAWKFMGNMNLFTRFPADVAGKGLINPYLFVNYSINKKVSIRSDVHSFNTMYHLGDGITRKKRKFLGIENDISVKFQPNSNWEINYGFSFMKPTSAMALLPKVEDVNKIVVWSYLMLAYNINVFQTSKSNK